MSLGKLTSDEKRREWDEATGRYQELLRHTCTLHHSPFTTATPVRGF